MGAAREVNYVQLTHEHILLFDWVVETEKEN